MDNKKMSPYGKNTIDVDQLNEKQMLGYFLQNLSQIREEALSIKNRLQSQNVVNNQ